jgi:hypothetical protein
MIYTKMISRASGALLLALLPVGIAHGGGESMDVDMGMHGSNTTTQPLNGDDYPDTYFAHTEHAGVIYTHIALMVLTWVFILPISKFSWC